MNTLEIENLKIKLNRNVLHSFSPRQKFLYLYDYFGMLLQNDEQIVCSYLLEQIESLKDELRLDKNDSNFIVDDNDSYNKVRSILERLQYKSQLQTYDTIFTEAIVFGTGMIETIFDGKKEYFGYRPNMEGWTDSVKIQLTRMQPEKTKVVSGIIQNYKINVEESSSPQFVVTSS